MPDRPKHEMLDACRPGRDDHVLPALTELAGQLQQDAALRETLDRSQRWDAAVSQAVEDVPLPAGLEARLQQQLSQAPAEASIAARPRQWRLRHWLALAAAAALLLMAGRFWTNPAPPIDGFALTQMADDWAQQLDDSNWLNSPPPADYPWDENVGRSAATGWRRIALLDDAQAIVFHNPVGREPVLLFVIRTARVTGLGPAPPYEPQCNSGQRRIGAWQNGDLVYVLVVPGSLNRYHNTLARPQTA